MKTHFRAAEGLYLDLPCNAIIKKNIFLTKLVSHIDRKVKKPSAPAGQKPRSPRYSSSRNDIREIEGGDSVKNGLQLQKSATLVMDDENELAKKQTDKQQQIEVIDPSEASKDVLLKCNIIKTKKPNAHNLRRGEGHLMGMSDLTLGEIYREFYPDVIDLRASI